MLTEEEKQKRKSTKTVAELYEGQIFTFMTDHAFALHLEENRRPKPWKEYDLTSTKTEEKAPSEESEEEIMVKPKKTQALHDDDSGPNSQSRADRSKA